MDKALTAATLNTTAMNTKQVIDELHGYIRRTARGIELEPVTAGRDGRWGFSVRYLGDWMVPLDEEDDGDYDWKIPTPETAKAFDALCAARTGKTVKVTWCNEGEKNWVRFSAAVL